MWIYIQTIVVSLCIIGLIDYLWNYIKDTYSTKKTKDLVGIQTEKYKTILNEMMQNKTNIQENEPHHFINDEQTQMMNDDLTQFMEQQMNN